MRINPGQDLSLRNPTQPIHGVLTITSNGTFTYRPHNDYFGTDYFSYQVCAMRWDRVSLVR
ncbi:MAG: cadherin-like domain-containing protein [Chloroflexi bacterium]|nr:cadherin-like domain-containing protein [Chloroflexota bacterium]